MPQLPEGSLFKIKTALYSVAAICVFLGWALTIAVFTQGGQVGGATKYYFFMTWISIPAFVYGAATPLFPRTQNFANPYWFAIVDVLYTILWLAAFASVAAWTKAGIKDSTKGCVSFMYGDETKCHLSQATVGFGVVIWLLFAALSGISVYTLLYYRRTGDMPNTKSLIGKPTLQGDSMSFNYTSAQQGADDEEAQNLNYGHSGIEHNEDDHSDHSGDHEDHLEMPSIPTSALRVDNTDSHPPYAQPWGPDHHFQNQQQQQESLSAPPAYSRAQSPSYGQPVPPTHLAGIPSSLQTGAAGRISPLPATAPYNVSAAHGHELSAYDRQPVVRDFLPPDRRAGSGYDTGYHGGFHDDGERDLGVGSVPYPDSDRGY
ncbi:MAG: hypothetical protein MMC33_005234 [Icmadophila ericetorum]|nr:hypothetical protein [Icmadophila ericetorum]